LNNLREHDSLPIQRAPVRRNSLPPKALLHVHPPRLVKCHPSLFHDPINLSFRPFVQAPPAVLRFNILRQIEVGGVEAGLSVLSEGRTGGQTHVAEAGEPVGDVRRGVVDRLGYAARGGDVGDGRRIGLPAVARYIQDLKADQLRPFDGPARASRTGSTNEEDEGQRIEDVSHGGRWTPS